MGSYPSGEADWPCHLYEGDLKQIFSLAPINLFQSGNKKDILTANIENYDALEKQLSS